MNFDTSHPDITQIQNRRGMGVALIISVLFALYLTNTYGWRQAALFAVGLSAGVILYHAAFGFTAAWREVVTTGRGAGLRAQMVMLGVAVLCFVPLLSQGEFAGTNLRGSVAPLSASIPVGAFMFGVGMQLGGGCASGTLFTAGGGNVRILFPCWKITAPSVRSPSAWCCLPVSGLRHRPMRNTVTVPCPLLMMTSLSLCYVVPGLLLPAPWHWCW